MSDTNKYILADFGLTDDDENLTDLYGDIKTPAADTNNAGEIEEEDPFLHPPKTETDPYSDIGQPLSEEK